MNQVPFEISFIRSFGERNTTSRPAKTRPIRPWTASNTSRSTSQISLPARDSLHVWVQARGAVCLL